MPRVHRSEQTRHLVVRFGGGETLPGDLAAVLRGEGVTCGWVRASGVLAEVELRAFDPEIGGPGSARRLAGPVQVLALDGGVGVSGGETAVSLRAVVARETDRGLETLAGEIAGAKVVALEAFVTALDGLSLERTLDEGAGVWLFGPGGIPAGGPRPPRPPQHDVPSRPQEAPARPAAPAAWSSALEASADTEGGASAARDRSAPRGGGPAIPQRPAKQSVDLDSPAPEPGDMVEHFAFGRAEVLKSDGDRLHLRVHKDGRIREIALEMLRVTRLEDSGGRRHFKLERRL